MKAITVKFYGPTNTRGSRCCASDLDRNKVIISTNRHHPTTASRDAAVTLCKKMNWSGTLYEGALNKRGDTIYVFATPECCIMVEEEEDLRK